MNPTNPTVTAAAETAVTGKFTLGLLGTVAAVIVSAIVSFATQSFHAVENAQQRIGILESQRQTDAARLQRIEDKLDRLVEQMAGQHPTPKPARPNGSALPAKPDGLELAAALLRPWCHFPLADPGP